MRMVSFLSVILIMGCAAAAAEPVYVIPELAKSGDVLSVAAVGTDITRFEIDVRSIDDTYVVSAVGFRYEVTDGVEVWMAMAGIPSDTESGTYHIHLSVEDGTGNWSRVRSTEIELPPYPQEEIALSSGMSTLRTSEDERKADEWRTLKEIYQTTNVTEVFHYGEFQLPLEAPVRKSSEYGVRRRFLYHDGGEGYSIHNGVDYAVPVGTPVYSCGAGRVVLAADRILSGFSVVIEHLPGVYSTYYHLSRLDVTLGEQVDTGSLIGASGATGLVTGPHLHWEIRVSGIPVSPEVRVAAPMIDKRAISSIIELQISAEGR